MWFIAQPERQITSWKVYEISCLQEIMWFLCDICDCLWFLWLFVISVIILVISVILCDFEQDVRKESSDLPLGSKN